MMLRLSALLIFGFLISFLLFAAIKLFVVALAVIVYGGHYIWSVDDLRFILIRGACLGVVFSVFAVVQYFRTR